MQERVVVWHECDRARDSNQDSFPLKWFLLECSHPPPTSPSPKA